MQDSITLGYTEYMLVIFGQTNLIKSLSIQEFVDYLENNPFMKLIWGHMDKLKK